MLDQLPLGVFGTSSGNVDFCNKECARIISPNAQPGVMTADSFAGIKEAGNGESLKDIITNPASLPGTLNKQYELENEAGQKYYFSIRYSTITFKGRQSTAIILQDQTSFEELKGLEEKYQRLYLASVVHDIRTPLNGILGMLEVIEGYNDKEEVKSFINVAKSSAKLLLFLTYDITDYSQIEAGKLSVVNSEFSPEEVVEECIQLLEFNFKRKEISLYKVMDGLVPYTIFSDRNRYMQILLNLLGNALKFTTHGEVKISVSYSSATDFLITSVTDTGIGIKDEDIPKLFKLFGKIKENEELNPTGVGLGLAICKKLSEYLGGKIAVASVYGQGSTFTFSIQCNVPSSPYPASIPLRPEGSSVEIAEEKGTGKIRNQPLDSYTFDPLIHASPMQKLQFLRKEDLVVEERKGIIIEEEKCDCPKLLIVDDNDSNIFVLQSYATLSHIKCDVARGGIEALEKVERRMKNSCCRSYRLILMDINMPVMDGIKATHKIRKLERECNAATRSVIIALTAAITEKSALREQHRELEFDGLLGKPISRNEFKDLLNKYI